MKNHILIVEDEKDLLSTLQYNFANLIKFNESKKINVNILIFYTYPNLGGK